MVYGELKASEAEKVTPENSGCNLLDLIGIDLKRIIFSSVCITLVCIFVFCDCENVTEWPLCNVSIVSKA